MTGRRIARALLGTLGTLGTLVILAVGLYLPATLLGPLPTTTGQIVSSTAGPASYTRPALPASGESAINDGIDGDLAISAGGDDAVPMAAITKIVTALVVLDRRPMTGDGASVVIGAVDYQDYIDYSNAGARTVIVFPGETWTQRSLLQALVLGSSSNHADTLARWAYGDVAEFVIAANSWLAAHGMPDTTLADATGLSPKSTGTADDLATLAALAMQTPAFSSLIESPVTGLAGDHGVTNTTSYLPDDGYTNISLSYAEEAGVCFLFTASLSLEEVPEPYRFYGVFLGEPDYETLDAHAHALAESARAGVSERPLLAEGEVLGSFDTEWGNTSDAVSTRTVSVLGWQVSPAAVRVVLDPVSTAAAGALVGHATPSATPESPVALRLSARRGDPGPFWRLTNPVPMIAALLSSWSSTPETRPSAPATP